MAFSGETDNSNVECSSGVSDRYPSSDWFMSKKEHAIHTTEKALRIVDPYGCLCGLAPCCDSSRLMTSQPPALSQTSGSVSFLVRGSMLRSGVGLASGEVCRLGLTLLGERPN